MDEQDYQVRILLGVWGESFIENFLEYSLPSLLAPGNIPALAAEYPVTFVFLTCSSDVPVFEDSFAIQQLKKHCKIEYVSIRDLIVFGNYSTTLTYAFDRAIRQTGEEMLKTYFIFLTADYIMADGSMQGLMRYMQKGYSGICAGNFQVIKEDIEPQLLSHIDPVSGVMQISPRDLVKYSLPCLHPVTIASITNQDVLHNYNANRFFVTEGLDTIAGRFYLLHMLCIKPETMNYHVGASCDYSFIPEMCPSGNIAIINDSDDYLVVETQPKDHELNHVMWGKYKQKYMLSGLREWTTAQHRANSRETIYYHSKDLTTTNKNNITEKFDYFIDSTNKKLDKYPAQPFRNHPYWQGAIQSFESQRIFLSDKRDIEFVNYPEIMSITRARKFYYMLYGSPPKVYPWHYRWFEYRSVLGKLKQLVPPNKSNRVLFLYSAYIQDFITYRQWCGAMYENSTHYSLNPLLQSGNSVEDISLDGFDHCILMVRLIDMKKLRQILMMLKTKMPDNANIVVIIPNEKRAVTSMVFNFQGEFSARMNALTNVPYTIKNITPITSNASVLGAIAVSQLTTQFSYSRVVRLVVCAMLAVPGTIIILATNLISRFLIKSRHCTDIIVALTPNNEGQ